MLMKMPSEATLLETVEHDPYCRNKESISDSETSLLFMTESLLSSKAFIDGSTQVDVLEIVSLVVL